MHIPQRFTQEFKGFLKAAPYTQSPGYRVLTTPDLGLFKQINYLSIMTNPQRLQRTTEELRKKLYNVQLCNRMENKI